MKERSMIMIKRAISILAALLALAIRDERRGRRVLGQARRRQPEHGKCR
jgi:hypothetical protein